MLFSTVAVPVYISCNGVHGFLFFHILANAYFYQDVKFIGIFNTDDPIIYKCL